MAIAAGDLEERIAELEATTARKGNRKVSLTISGYVNEQVQYWNDGVESNVYQGTNESDQTRFRFVGKAKINNDWSAGYILELGVKGASQGTYNASNDEGSAGNAATVSVRHSAWYVESQTYGRVTTGHTSEATDSITELTLAKTITVEKPIQIFTPNAGFQVRSGSGGTIGLTWAQLSTVTNGPGEGDRYDVVRYDSPTFGGFTASASWGEDDMWAVALRYAGEFHGFKLAAGFGYSEITDGSPASGAFGERGFTKLTTGGGHDVDGDEYGGSVSVLHVESGLFATFAYGKSEDHNRKGLAGGGITAAQIDGDDEGWNIQAGVYKKWLPLGPTTIYGEYYQGNFGSAANSTDTAIATAGDGVISGKVLGTQVDVWGAAAVQTIDAAALELYISYRHYDADVTTTAGVLDTKAFDTVFSGAKISF
ncbi:MAG: hypothetical protein WDN31_22225 [Hyphomicrobium sp.]